MIHSPEAPHPRVAQSSGALTGTPRSRRVSIAATAALCLVTLLLTRQSQFSLVAGLAAPFALAVVLIAFRLQPASGSLLPMLIYCGLSCLASLFIGHEPGDVFRFFAITAGTLLAFHIRPARVAGAWAMLPVAVQAALVLAISLGLTFAQSPEVAEAVRRVAQETQWGDIYSHDGVYFRVQVVGNALLPLLFMVCLWRSKVSRFYRALAFVSLLALFAAGNLTYMFVAALAIALRFRDWLLATATRAGACILLAMLGVGLTWSAIEDALSTKFDGADSSMGVRFDQIEAAYQAVGESPVKLLFGAGLGAPFPDGRERKYSDSQYIELQALYLTYQLGGIGTLLYLATLVYSSHRFLRRDGRVIFWLFLLAGSTNPYILDTNQIAATAILIWTYPRRSLEEDRSAHTSAVNVRQSRASRDRH